MVVHTAKARWSFDDVGVPSFEVPKKEF